jgi:predicted enzyme related to lactoylglutathione lyase
MTQPAGGGLMRPGKLSFVQIPAQDTAKLGEFYAAVFGWKVREGTADHVSFEDRSGELIGAFVTEWPVGMPGIVPYLSVADVPEALARIEAHGGSVHTPMYAEGSLWVARFKDPAGNVMGVWQMG